MVSLLCIGIVLFAGIIGGLVNAVLSDNGFIWPRYQDRDGVKILRPGVLGNCLVSAVAAFVSWGLYGPAAAVHLVGATNPTPLPLTLTAGMVAGALLVGIAGARWLTNEVDKDLLRAAATYAARRSESAELSQKLALVRPADALRLCKSSNLGSSATFTATDETGLIANQQVS